MKKIVLGLVMFCLISVNVLLPVKGNSFTDATDVIKYELDTNESVDDLSIDAVNIYSFQVEEKGAYCFEADYAFEDKDDKVMSLTVINMNASKDLLDIPLAELSDEQVYELLLNMLNSVQYNIDDETNDLTYITMAKQKNCVKTHLHLQKDNLRDGKQEEHLITNGYIQTELQQNGIKKVNNQKVGKNMSSKIKNQLKT